MENEKKKVYIFFYIFPVAGTIEMNKKAWNFIEINELSGWHLAPLRK